MKTPTDQDFFETEEKEPFNLKEVVYKYLGYWKFFLISFVLALACAFAYLKYTVPIYKIQASIVLKDEKKGVGQDQMLKEFDIFSSSKIVDNEIEILRSYTLMEKVVRKLNLNISYGDKRGLHVADSMPVYLYQKSPIYLQLIGETRLTYKKPIDIEITGFQYIMINGLTYPLNDTTRTPYGIFKITLTGISPGIKELFVTIHPVNSTTEGLIKALQVEASSKMSSVLNLSIEDPIPQRGKDILNSLINGYINDAVDDKNIEAANTLTFIEKRLKLISGDINKVEDTVEKFKNKEGITDLSEESKDYLASIEANDAQMDQVKIQQSVLDGIEEYVKNRKNQQDMVPGTISGLSGMTTGLSDPTLITLISKLTELEMQKESSIRITGAENPVVTGIEAQISNLKSDILENIQSIKENLSHSVLQIENQNKQLEGIIRNIPDKERTLVDISREEAIKSNLYNYLLQTKEETQLTLASTISDSRIIDSARSSISPVKPIPKMIILVFVLIGIGIPFGWIYVIDSFNDRIRNKKDIEKATRIPIMGEISFAKHANAIIVDAGNRTIFAEQMRALRTNLSYLSIGKDIQTILFTSSMSGEGKSFISLNLGASIAITGKKTIILEFDMRKPKLRSILKLEDAKGLSNYLIGRAELNDIIRPIPGLENFYIITCGPIPPNPVELLLNGRLESLIAELKNHFDHIIIDAPPIGAVTDAQILEKQADATLFMLRQGHTPKENIKIADSLYKETKFKKLNLVFNGIRKGGKYGYGYGQAYGYYEGKNKSSGLLKRILNKK